MPIELLPDHRSVRANCPECKGAMTTYEAVSVPTVPQRIRPTINGRNHTLVGYHLLKCAGCGRGGLSSVAIDDVTGARGPVKQFTLLEFLPRSIDNLSLPNDLPPDLASEFREGELVAAVGAWRAASAMMRSTLEKALKHSGYTKDSLKNIIDKAAADGAITAARSARAHEDIRVLGNDVLHDDWKAISEDDFELSHRYTHRILEDLYDDRPSVLKLLASKGRKPIDAS